MSVYKRADDKELNASRECIIKELDTNIPCINLCIITTENNVIHIPQEGVGLYDSLISLINGTSPILAAAMNDEDCDGGITEFSIDSDIIYGLLDEANDIVYALAMYAIAKIKDNIDVITNYRTNLSHLFYRGSLCINYHYIDYLEPIVETKMDNPIILYPLDSHTNKECELIRRQWWILQKLEKIIDDAVGDRDRHKWIHEHLVSSSKLIKKLPRKRPVGQRFFDDIIEGEKFDDMVDRWRTKGTGITGKVFDKICDEETKAFLASRKAYTDDVEQKRTKKEEIAALRKRLQELEKEMSDT